MAADTVLVVLIRDGLSNVRPSNFTADSSLPAVLTAQHAVRTNGAPVERGNGLPTYPDVGALLNSATAVATQAATPVVPFSATRKFVHVFSRTTGVETVDLGSANVAVGSGIPISSGGGFSFLGSGAAGPIYAITTVAASPLSYVEG